MVPGGAETDNHASADNVIDRDLEGWYYVSSLGVRLKINLGNEYQCHGELAMGLVAEILTTFTMSIHILLGD